MKNKTKVVVKVKKGNITQALKLFKRKGMDSGHPDELRDRKYYTKPTTKRRRSKQEAVRKQQRENLNNDI